MFKTVMQDVEAEIVEKKSKFIAQVYYVQTEAEAQEKLEQIRKTHYDARHHCFAYRIMPKREQGVSSASVIERMSDDGEPSGTAGAPLLTILRKQNLMNVLVVVIRYFGGILLGTGGLVRAYSEACQKALSEAELVEEKQGLEVCVEIPYASLEQWKYVCRKRGISIVRVEYGNVVKVICEMTEEEKEELLENTAHFQIMSMKMIQYKNIRKA